VGHSVFGMVALVHAAFSPLPFSPERRSVVWVFLHVSVTSPLNGPSVRPVFLLLHQEIKGLSLGGEVPIPVCAHLSYPVMVKVNFQEP
jgi:hypothetical protein